MRFPRIKHVLGALALALGVALPASADNCFTVTRCVTVVRTFLGITISEETVCRVEVHCSTPYG